MGRDVRRARPGRHHPPWRHPFLRLRRGDLAGLRILGAGPLRVGEPLVRRRRAALRGAHLRRPGQGERAERLRGPADLSASPGLPDLEDPRLDEHRVARRALAGAAAGVRQDRRRGSQARRFPARGDPARADGIPGPGDGHEDHGRHAHLPEREERRRRLHLPLRPQLRPGLPRPRRQRPRHPRGTEDVQPQSLAHLAFRAGGGVVQGGVRLPEPRGHRHVRERLRPVAGLRRRRAPAGSPGSATASRTSAATTPRRARSSATTPSSPAGRTTTPPACSSAAS